MSDQELPQSPPAKEPRPSVEDDSVSEGKTDVAPPKNPSESMAAKESKRAQKTERSSSKRYPSVSFGENLEIIPDSPRPHLDSGSVHAYEVTGRGKYTGNYFALVCEMDLIPRTNSIQTYLNFTNPSLVKLVDSNVVFWPPAAEQRYVFIYEDNLGSPLLEKGSPQALGLKPEFIMDTVIKQMVSVLRDFRDKEFIHGNIRLSNIYDGGIANFERIILGECLSAPVSHAQSCVYESVERAMADSVAKGQGSKEDDMYALGMVLAILLRQNDPLEGMSEREIIEYKIEYGSYIAAVGKDRMTGPVLELLRGLLYDDPSQRWTYEEVEAWMDGQRLSPKQISKKPKAARPLTFNNKKYLRPSLLAMELHDNISEASQLIEGGNLMQWLARSLEIKDADELVEKVIKTAAEPGRGSMYNERLVSRMSVVLDSDAPIRFCGMNMRPDGIGPLLARSIIRKHDLLPFAEIIMDHSVLFWLDAQRNSRIDASVISSRFDGCRAFVRQKNAGYGIERCLYVLCPESPCLSEKLKGYYVRTPEDLLYAYEDICSKGKAPVSFMDRHIVAFLSIKDRNVIDPFLVDINSGEKHVQLLAGLDVLASIQKRSKMEKFPEIAKVYADILAPVYLRFHDRDLRKSLKEKVEEAKKKGDFAKMSTILNNPDMSRWDYRNYRNAMIEYNNLKKEKRKLEIKMQNERDFGKSTGRQVAAIVSGLIGGIIIVLFAIITFSG